MTMGISSFGNGFVKAPGEKNVRSTPLLNVSILAAHSGAMRRNVSASKGDTSNVRPNACAASRSSFAMALASRAKTQRIGPDEDLAYCRHLSESTSTMSKIARRHMARCLSRYGAIADPKTIVSPMAFFVTISSIQLRMARLEKKAVVTDSPRIRSEERRVG